MEAAETACSVTNADPGTRQFVEAVAQAHNKAREYVHECKIAFEKRLRDDIRNALRHVKDFQAGDIVRHRMSDSDLKTMGRNKLLHPVNSKRMVVVESLGFGRYKLQEYNNAEAYTVQSSADLMTAETSPADEDKKKAMLHAICTREKITEYEIEKVIGERGVIAQGTKQYKVKWKDHSATVTSWEDHTTFSKKTSVLQAYKAAKKAQAHSVSAVANIQTIHAT